VADRQAFEQSIRIDVSIRAFALDGCVGFTDLDFAIRQAKATGRPTLGDSDGLSLAISAQGRKSWHFRYYRQATQEHISLGT